MHALLLAANEAYQWLCGHAQSTLQLLSWPPPWHDPGEADLALQEHYQLKLKNKVDLFHMYQLSCDRLHWMPCIFTVYLHCWRKRAFSKTQCSCVVIVSYLELGLQLPREAKDYRRGF